MGAFDELIAEEKPAEKKGGLDSVLFAEKPVVTPKQDIREETLGFQEKLRGRLTEGLREKAASVLEFGMEAPGRQMASVRGAAETFQGGHQLLSEGMERVGLIDPGSTEKLTKQTEADRAVFNKAFREEFGDSVSFDIAEFMGRLAPALAIPGGVTIPGAVTTGGALGATEFVPSDAPEGQRLKNVEVGAAFGLGAQTLNALPAIKRFIINKIGLSKPSKKVFKALDAFPEASVDDIAKMTGTDKTLVESTKFAKEGIELSQRSGIDLKLSQITGDVRQEWLEQLARGGEVGERLGRRIETKQVIQSFKNWERIKSKLFPKEKILERAADPDTVKFGFKVQSAFKRMMGSADNGTGMIGQRASQANKDFALVDEAVGNQPIIDLGNFTEQIQSLVAENTQRGAGVAQRRLAKELTGLLEQFKEVPKASGKEIQNLLRDYGNAAKGKKQIFKALDESFDKRPYRLIKESLEKDLDSAAEGGTEVAQLLRNARNNYAKSSSLIKEVEDTAVGALFGKGKNPTIREIEDSFFRMKPETIDSTMKILKDIDPALQRRLQRFWLERWMIGATKTADADVFPFIAGKMADLGTDPAFKSVFNDTASKKLIKDGINAARRVILNNTRTGGRDSSKLKNLAGILASRDPTFVARFAADIFTPKLVSKALLDPDGIKALLELAKPYEVNRATAALITLNNVAQEEDRE